MKKIKTIVMVTILMTTFLSTAVMASGPNTNVFKSKTMYVEGYAIKNNPDKSYRKIIRSYKKLTKLKSYIKKNYNSPKKYLKELKKYNKKYFKKNALVFVTKNNDMNSKTYELLSVNRKNNKIIISVSRDLEIKEGVSTPAVIRYGANTYFISVKQSKIKKAKKVKVVYKDKQTYK